MRHLREVVSNGATNSSCHRILILLLMSPWSSMVRPEYDASSNLDLDRNVEFFSIRTDAYSDFVGTYASSMIEEQRPIEAHSVWESFQSMALNSTDR